MNPFKPIAPLVTPGSKGVAVLDTFTVDKAHAVMSQLREAITQGREQAVPEGTYARLVVNGELMMTDTPMEQRSNLLFVEKAKGDVLIAGLGIGMVLQAILQKPEVGTVLVLEKYQDVIDLVSPQFQEYLDEGKLHILCEDILDWHADDDWTWDTIYFDIWPTISIDNLDDMNRLDNQFRYHLNPEGWIDSWERTALRRLVARGGLFGGDEDESEDEDEEGVEFEPESDDEDLLPVLLFLFQPLFKLIEVRGLVHKHHEGQSAKPQADQRRQGCHHKQPSREVRKVGPVPEEAEEDRQRERLKVTLHDAKLRIVPVER